MSINNKEKMKSLDKRYMLFLYGDFSVSDNFADDVSYQLITIVSSKFIKFNYGEFGMVCHFRSEETFENLKEYIDMVLSDITDQYFLMEVGENFDVKMDSDLKKDFLNIDGDRIENRNGSIEVNEVSKPEDKKILDSVIHMLFPVMDPTFFGKKEEIIEPTLDEILDKISDKGIESITEREKQFLENYGKRKND